MAGADLLVVACASVSGAQSDWFTTQKRTRIIVCRLVLNARASADTLSPAVNRALTSVCCSSLSDGGRPKR